MSNTTTYSYAAGGNNELQSMTVSVGGTDDNVTSFTYDDWGRTDTETLPDGTVKTYLWTMANMLAGVDSSDANDADVQYFYRGDLKRIWRVVDASIENVYDWDAGFNVVAENDVSMDLTRTYIACLAEIIGPNPATGTHAPLPHA